MCKRIAQFALIIALSLPLIVAAEYRKEGNLALPITQMPGPLFSLGQTIITEHDVLIAVTPNYIKSEGCNNTTYVTNDLYYGITEDLTIFARLPVFIKARNDCHESSGLGDFILQGEYAFHSTESETFLTQATVVGAIVFPTGSTSKNPPLGFGSTSFLLGATYSYISIDWYAFISGGALFTTPHHHIKPGNQYFYECGLGYNLFNPDGWCITGIIEADGAFQQQETVCRKKNSNSGGNSIFLGPVIYAASERFTIEAGIQWPVLQQLNGQQEKTDFRAAILFGLRF